MRNNIRNVPPEHLDRSISKFLGNGKILASPVISLIEIQVSSIGSANHIKILSTISIEWSFL
jgi:hypothetical protein